MANKFFPVRTNRIDTEHNLRLITTYGAGEQSLTLTSFPYFEH